MSDARILKRRNAKLKEKEKTKELLSLVEELTHNCEFYKNALKHKDDRQETQTYQLRKENESIHRQVFKLGQEIEEWKAKCENMEHKSTALAKAKTLTKENKDLLEDIEVHKSVICRLNKELSFYQDKLKSKYKDQPENIVIYSTSSEQEQAGGDEGDPKSTHTHHSSSKEWLERPRKSLLPLLIAYDEMIEEKEEIIKDHEQAIERFKSECKTIANENAHLHKMVSDNESRGTISIDEWESLRSNAVLVLEENDLLHGQVDNFKLKEEKLFATFQEKAASFKQTINQLETELNRQKNTVADLETRCRNLAAENQHSNAALQTMISREKHDATIQEFKQTFEGLKSTYNSDKKSWSDKVNFIQKEKEELIGQVAKLESENNRLKEDLQKCDDNLLKSSGTLQNMEASVQEQRAQTEATGKVIEDLMKHVQQLATEKNNLAVDLNEQKLVNEQVMHLRTQENELVTELHGKIEAMERLHIDEIKQAQQRTKEVEDNLRSHTERHRREVAQLKELIKEKERRIENGEAEKKQLQLDLETVWKTTTSTIQNTIKGRHS